MKSGFEGKGADSDRDGGNLADSFDGFDYDANVPESPVEPSTTLPPAQAPNAQVSTNALSWPAFGMMILKRLQAM